MDGSDGWLVRIIGQDNFPLPLSLPSPDKVTSPSLEGKGRLLASNLIPFLRREKVGGAGRAECHDQLLRLSFMNNTISQDVANRRNVTMQAGNGSSLRISLNVHNSCKMRGVLHIQHAGMPERQNSHHFTSCPVPLLRMAGWKGQDGDKAGWLGLNLYE